MMRPVTYILDSIVSVGQVLYAVPVYAWGIPPVVVSRIKEMDLNGIRCHMVCTCGDETGNIDRQSICRDSMSALFMPAVESSSWSMCRSTTAGPA